MKKLKNLQSPFGFRVRWFLRERKQTVLTLSTEEFFWNQAVSDLNATCCHSLEFRSQHKKVLKYVYGGDAGKF